MLYLDVECYKDYFLIQFLNRYGKVASYEKYGDSDLDKDAIKRLMKDYRTVGFNSISYDLPMIAASLEDRTCAELKALSDEIITSGKPSWAIVRKEALKIPEAWKHTDIFNVVPGMASLKIYGARIGMKKLQELPFQPDNSISPADRKVLRKYCTNDLRVTRGLHQKITKQLDLRTAMGEEYGLDLQSKSDAQIAEAVLRSEIYTITQSPPKPPVVKEGATFRYVDPKNITFKTPELRDLLKRLIGTEFRLAKSGSIALPDWLKATRIKIGGGAYRMGIGGLHSSEKGRTITAGKDEFLADFDVTSYYPSIILQQGIAPVGLGDDFLTVYGKIVNARLAAKRSGNKVAADTLKIVINGSFGKLGSKYSALYAPNLLIQTTITGQLALLMLIERMEEVGVSVVSANTDGIVVLGDNTSEEDVAQVVSDWELDAQYGLERSDYTSLHNRDVNNYIAVKPDGTTKRKGVFADAGLMKNPAFGIVSDAIASHVSGGAGYVTAIHSCEDINKFVMVRTVNGGAIWRGDTLGKAVRFYYSTEVGAEETINYVTNGNKVPQSDGGKPCLDLPETMPTDIDRERYVRLAQTALEGIGYA